MAYTRLIASDINTRPNPELPFHRHNGSTLSSHNRRHQDCKDNIRSYSLYNDSFILEFLAPPPALNATVLLRSTYLSPSNQLGKSHPQAPPLHRHFSASFLVTNGLIGTTLGYEAKDQAWGAGTHHAIPPWTPHCFWPHPDAIEDSTMFVRAHPDAGAA